MNKLYCIAVLAFGMGIANAKDKPVPVQIIAKVVDVATKKGLYGKRLQITELTPHAFTLASYDPRAEFISDQNGSIRGTVWVTNSVFIETRSLGCRIIDPEISALTVDRSQFVSTGKIELTLNVLDCDATVE